MKQGSEIAPRRRGGRRVNEFLIQKFSELCELCASVVNISSQETRNNLKFKPVSGEPLLRELTRLWKYKVRRFRLIYEVDRKARLIRIFAIGH